MAQFVEMLRPLTVNPPSKGEVFSFMNISQGHLKRGVTVKPQKSDVAKISCHKVSDYQ